MQNRKITIKSQVIWLFRLGVISVLMSAVILLLLNVSVDDETFNQWLNTAQILNVTGVLLVALWGILKIRK